MNASSILTDLLSLSHELGREDRRMAILGEGNTSARLSADTFTVKASGQNLGSLCEEGLTECRFDKLLPLLDEKHLDDAAVDAALLASRTDSNAKKPSVEALFHAWLLTLPDVQFVGHTHSIAVNQLLCSPRAQELAERRLFPDEIVCCGTASVLVPYTDPGLKLSQAIRDATLRFIEERNDSPRVILLKNHGVITLGKTPSAVLASALMAEKAASIFVGAAMLGGPDFLSPEQVQRIAGRPDEHYRRKALNL